MTGRFFAGCAALGLMLPLADFLVHGQVGWLGVAGLGTASASILWWLITQAVNSKGAEAWAEGFMYLCPECESAPLRHQQVFLGTDRPEKERFECRPLCDACGWSGTWAKVHQLRQAKWDQLTAAIHQYYIEGAGGHES